MVKVFILDLDGTLIDSHDLHVASFKPLLEKYNINAKGFVLKKYFGMIAEDILRNMFPELSEEAIKKIVLEKRKLFLDKISLVKKSLCADAFLSKISSKGKLVMASSSSREEIIAVLKQLGWINYFSLIISGYEIKNPKPAPDMLIKAVNQLNVTVNECVYIGDSIYDAMAARSAGMRFIGLTTGSFRRSDFIKLGFKHIYKNLCSLTRNLKHWFN